MWRRPVDVAFGLAVAAATAWCLFLRTAEITSVPGINGDEAFTAAKALLWLRGEPMSLRTGSGLFPDPVSFGQLVGLHLLWSPSLWLIRAPAVLSGLASVAIAFYLGRRLWGTRTAIALAVLFACLPAHLAYARLGWEPADTPLAAVLVLTSALLWHWSATLALFVLALLVHPTNVFLGPIALAVQVRRGSPFQGRQLLEPRLLALYAGGAGLAAFFAIRRPAVVERAFESLAGMADRVTIGEPFQLFASRYLDFLSGVGVYRYLVDPADPPTGWLHRSVAAACLLAIVLLVYRRRVGARGLDTAPARQAARRLLGGVFTSLALFYLASGPDALQPHFARYGLWMIAPHCLLLVAVLHEFLQERVRRVAVPAACAGLALLALLSFHVHYWRALHEQNSRTEPTFASGPVEPKSAAFDAIEAARGGAEAVIHADSWWTYWPLKYRALAASNVDVTMDGMEKRERGDVRRFYVRFHAAEPPAALPAPHMLTLMAEIRGFGDLPVIDVFQDAGP